MNIIKLFLCILLFFPSLLRADETVNTPLDEAKGALPACTPDYALYLELVKIGEKPLWVAEESLGLAGNQEPPIVAFSLNKKTGSWSFVRTTYLGDETCFVVTGKNWQKTDIETPEQITIGGVEKKVGYCAPLEQISKELLEKGSVEVGFGFPDSEYLKNGVVKATVHLFSGSGTWARVTEAFDKDGVKKACIDAQGGEQKQVQN